MNVDIICRDCIDGMRDISPESIDVVVTSPPYNLEIDYNNYSDSLPYDKYLEWCELWITAISRVLSANGSFFLNVGSSPKLPWIPFDVANIARKYFNLQNKIIWVKSISIHDRTYGQFKPLNSKRFVNLTNESIFHFTKSGNVIIDGMAIGPTLTDTSNIKRFDKASDKRWCDNSWFIPYDTTQSKKDKFNHPATFPIELPSRCIKLHGIHNTRIVMDPFSGAGSTAVACKKLGVNFIGFDISEEYCVIARNRVAIL